MLPMCGNNSQIYLPRLAELLEACVRAEAGQLLPLELRDLLPLVNDSGIGCAVHLGELRLVVERLEMRRPAGR